MKFEPTIHLVPEGTDPEEAFERIIIDHAMSHGIAPDRIEWQKITCPEQGVFLVPIKDHAEGPMRVTVLFSVKQR